MFNGMSLRVGAALVAIFASSLYAQKPLVRQRLDENQRLTLKGNLPPIVRLGQDLGAAPDNQPTGSLYLVLGRSGQQQRQLDRLAAQVGQPGTALYRHWLTPAQYGAQFGIAQADLDQVTTWMQANGLTVERVPAARNVIRFSGTMADLRTAFHTEIHRFAVGNRIELANDTEPSIPRALAPVVRGISGLSAIHPHSNTVLAGKSQPAPQFTSYGSQNWGPGQYDVYFEPVAGDAALIYDTPNPAMNPHYSGTAWTGKGVTVGIAGDSNLSSAAMADIARYRSLFLNEPLATAKTDPQMPKVVIDGADPGVNGDELEALTDVEMVSAMAPKAMITLYTAGDTDLQFGLFLAIERAVSDNNVQILNISFSDCEQDLGASGNAMIAELYQQAAAQGITITVSAGDSGSANCDAATEGNGAEVQGGLAVNGLASTPWNVAVGGTDFDVLYTTNLSTIENYVNVPGSSNQIAGTSPYFSSALGYIPEEPWNDSSESFTTYANNTPYYYGGNQNYPNDYGTGGGASSAAVCPGSIDATSGACSVHMTGYAKPAFQTSLAPADGVRDLPDVSFFSGHPMSDAGFSQNFTAAWGLCADSTVTGSGGTDCLTVAASGDKATGCGGTCAPNYGTTTVTPVGGTSTSAPLMAGVLALVIESQGGNRLGQADPILYNLALNHAADFHDVTTGNNSVVCVAGSPNCGSNGFLPGYNAAVGYDLASGIGSLDVAKIVSDWSSVKLTPTSAMIEAGTSANTLGTSPITIAHGSTVYFAVNTGQPLATGAVSLVYSGSNLDGSITTAPVSEGMASFSTADLPGGTYTVYADYGGDTSYAGSESNGITFTVTAESSTLSATVNAYDAETGNPSTTMAYGASFYADVVPYGSTEGISAGNPATGTVSLSLDSVKVATLTLDAEGKASYQLNSQTLTAGKHTIQAQYAGDSSYGPSTSSVSITIVPATAVKVTALPASGAVWTSTQSNTGVGINFNVWSAGVAPSGTVTFTMNGQVLGNPVPIWTNAGTAGEWVAGATMPVTPSQIGVGQTATFTATYSGDANYAAAAPVSTTVSVSGAGSGSGGGLSLTNSGGLSISAGGTASEIITIAPSGGLTGTVNLTCAQTAGSNGPACTIPATVTISGSGSQKVNATLSSASAAVQGREGGFPFNGMGGGALVLSALLFIPRRRNWARALLIVLAGTALTCFTACSGGSASTGSGGTGGTGGGGATSTTYTYTVTAAQGTASASTSFKVTVN